MATEKIIVEYIAEVDGLKAELKTVQKEMHNTEKAGVDAGKKTADAFAKTEEKTVSLKTQLKNLKAQLANATDPKEVERLAKAVGALADQLEDASDQAKIFSSESKFEQMGNALGSVKDKLMNLDFKGAADQSKLLVSVVKSFSVADVVSGIKDMGTALLNVGKSLLANPLFLLAGALVAIGYEAFQVGKALYEMNIQTITVTESIVAGNKAMLEYADRYAESQIKIRLALGQISEAKAKELQTVIKTNKEIRDKNSEHADAIIKLAKELGIDVRILTAEGNARNSQDDAVWRKRDLLAVEKFEREKAKLDAEFAREKRALEKSQNAEKLAETTTAYKELNKKTAEQVKKNNEDIAKLNQDAIDKKKEDDAKALEELKNLYSAINDLQNKYRETTLNSDAKEIQALFDKYDKIKLQAKGNKDALIKIEQIYKKELDALILKQTEADLKADADKLKTKQDLEDKIYLLTLSAKDREIAEVSNKYEQLIIEAEQAGEDASGLRAKQIEETNAVIKKQADDEVKLNDDKNKVILEKEKKVAEERKKLQQQVSQTISASIDAIAQISANITEQQIQDSDRETQAQIDNYDDLLQNKLITQKEHDDKIAELEKQKAEKQRQLKQQQFESDKQIAIIKIIMKTAEAVMSQFAETGYVGAILAGVVGAAELAVVVSQPTPKFEKGGEVGGKLHRQGGTFIEAEKGEYIINRKDSKDNKGLLEAINKGNGSKYIEDKFIAPMLKEQQKKFNQMKDNAFSDNLVNSMILNSSNFKDSNLLDSMKRSRQADRENIEYLVSKLKSNNNLRTM